MYKKSNREELQFVPLRLRSTGSKSRLKSIAETEIRQ
jgi:hypothetical protein